MLTAESDLSHHKSDFVKGVLNSAPDSGIPPSVLVVVLLARSTSCEAGFGKYTPGLSCHRKILSSREKQTQWLLPVRNARGKKKPKPVYTLLSCKMGGLSFMTYLPCSGNPWTGDQHPVNTLTITTTFLYNPGVLLQRVLNSPESDTITKGARNSSTGAECIIVSTPDILLVPTAGTGLPVRKRYYLHHQRKVAGLQFLGLPLQNRSLKDTLQTQGYGASFQQVQDAKWALLWRNESRTQANPLPVQMIHPWCATGIDTPVSSVRKENQHKPQESSLK